MSCRGGGRRGGGGRGGGRGGGEGYRGSGGRRGGGGTIGFENEVEVARLTNDRGPKREPGHAYVSKDEIKDLKTRYPNVPTVSNNVMGRTTNLVTNTSMIRFSSGKSATFVAYTALFDPMPTASELESAEVIKTGMLRRLRKKISAMFDVVDCFVPSDDCVITIRSKKTIEESDALVYENSDGTTCNITLKKRGDLIYDGQSSSAEENYVVDAIFREAISRAGFKGIGPKFRFKDDLVEKLPLDGFLAFNRVKESTRHLSLLRGYECTTASSSTGSYLEVSLKHRARMGPSMKDYITSFVNHGTTVGTLMSNLRGSTIITDYGNNKASRHDDYRLLDIEEKDINDFSHEDRNGERVTFAQYYEKKLGSGIMKEQQGRQYFLKLQRKGLADNHVFIPAAFCLKMGLDACIKSNMNMMKEICTRTRQPPDKKQACVMDFVQALGTSTQAKSFISAFNLIIEAKPRVVSGRVVQLAGQKVDVTGPSTDQDVSDMQLSRVVMIHAMANQYDNESLDFLEMNILMAARRRMQVPNGYQIPRIELPRENMQGGLSDAEESALLNQLNAIEQKKKVSCLALVVLPGKAKKTGDATYSDIKNILSGNEVRPRESQFLRMPLIQEAQRKQGDRRGVPASLSNVAGGVILKMGGKEFTRQSPLPWTQNCMMIGIDFIRKTVKGVKETCVGMVASTSPDLVRVYHSCSYYVGDREIANKLREFIDDALVEYQRQHNRKLPQHVIVFRNGLSEDQKASAYKLEVPQVNAGLHSAKTAAGVQGPAIEVVFIVVTKRIDLKIYQPKAELPPKTQSASRTISVDNCAPFTIVNRGLAPADRFEYCIVQCTPPPGTTATPTRYHVIYNSSKLSENDIEVASGFSCYLYQNWKMGPIRVPHVLMCADRLCSTAKSYLTWGLGTATALRTKGGFY